MNVNNRKVYACTSAVSNHCTVDDPYAGIAMDVTKVFHVFYLCHVLYSYRFTFVLVLSVCPIYLSCPVLSVTLVYCGQTVGQIKMKLGVVVGLGPGDIVLDGDPAPPPRKGHSSPPLFGHCSLWANGRPSQLLLSTCFSLPSSLLTFKNVRRVSVNVETEFR